MNSNISANERIFVPDFLKSLQPKFEKMFLADGPAKYLACEKRIRARIAPKQIRSNGLLGPETNIWLAKCAADIDCSPSEITYILPLLGITNRPLPGHKKGGLNLFKTLVRLNAKGNVSSLDQCAIEFGLRLPINSKQFIEELQRQIYSSRERVRTRGSLTFYCHNAFSSPATNDLETLRLAISKTMPTVNIDWVDPSMTWESLWNPCSNLEPIKAKLENKLIEFLNNLIEQICASRCNAVIQRRHCFFDNKYLPNRREKHLPDLNKITYLANSDMNNNRILDLFKSEKSFFFDLAEKRHTSARQDLISCADKEAGWLPAVIR